MTPTHDYSVFGLHIRSDLPLPELLAVTTASSPQVTVRHGKVPDAPATGVGPHLTDGGLLLVIDRVGRYFVKDGSEIIVERQPGVPDANVRLFLLGSAMGALLHQRGLLPLHANAVEIGGRAFAFMGASGSGKSTAAAWFHDRGFRVVADDVCVVGFTDDGSPQVRPGVGRLRLWREVLELSGRDVAEYNRSFTGDDAPDKYDVPLASPSATDAPIALAAVYLLERSEGLEIERLTGVDAAEAVFANTYRGAYVPMAGSGHDHWSACARLVSGTPIFRAGRRWDLADLDEQYGGLLEHAERLPGSE
jgi:hypothetical protein